MSRQPEATLLARPQNPVLGPVPVQRMLRSLSVYTKSVRSLRGKYTAIVNAPRLPRKLRYRDRAIVTDLDQSLIGDEASLQELLEVIRHNRKSVSFAIATGRRLDSAMALMKKHGIPTPDIFITSLGTRDGCGSGWKITEANLV